MNADDFYVEDEPLEDVLAAWETGEKGRTGLDLTDEERARITRLAVAMGVSETEVIKRLVMRFVHQLGASDRAEVAETITRELAAS